jgi:hypothetical protein
MQAGFAHGSLPEVAVGPEELRRLSHLEQRQQNQDKMAVDVTGDQPIPDPSDTSRDKFDDLAAAARGVGPNTAAALCSGKDDAPQATAQVSELSAQLSDLEQQCLRLSSSTSGGNRGGGRRGGVGGMAGCLAANEYLHTQPVVSV